LRRSHYHYLIFDRIRSADRAAVEFNRDFPPVHSPNLIEAAPGVHPAEARRIAANIAKLLGHLSRPSGIGRLRKSGLSWRKI